MTSPLRQLAVAAAACLFLCSCGEQEGFRKDTFPVTGKVVVDGQPATDVIVTCHNVQGMDQEHPTVSSAATGQDGKFEIATYEAADGVPEGDYVLTFEWKQRDLLKGGFSGPDKLNDLYSDPKASKVQFKVEKGKPTDLGEIQLSTK